MMLMSRGKRLRARRMKTVSGQSRCPRVTCLMEEKGKATKRAGVGLVLNFVLR